VLGHRAILKPSTGVLNNFLNGNTKDFPNSLPWPYELHEYKIYVVKETVDPRT
jgi:hypothetical protein